MVARAEKRPMGALGRMSFVVGMHAAALYVIGRSLGLVPPLIENKTEATFIEEARTEPDPLPRLEPEFVDPRPTFVIPEPEIDPFPTEMPPDTIAVEFRPADELPLTSGSADVVPVLTPARPDARRPLSQPPYPAELIRENVQGAVDVEVYVQPDGRVGDARIVKTSGYEAFDRATLNEARRKWRLNPATRDGVAVPQWYRLRVVFKLKDQ